jgi:hypothetical protein
MNMIKIALIGAALCLPATAFAKVPECYTQVGEKHDDGTTNKGEGGMYDIPLLRKLVYALIQELDETERQLTRNYEQFARLLGPCRLPDGTEFEFKP